MTYEQIPSAWVEALRRAEDLDPVIREALRPVFDRLRTDAPDQATSLTLAMMLRALRSILPPPGGGFFFWSYSWLTKASGWRYA